MNDDNFPLSKIITQIDHPVIENYKYLPCLNLLTLGTQKRIGSFII